MTTSVNSKESETPLLEMKTPAEAEEPAVVAVDHQTLDMALLEESSAVCQASCLSDPQTTAVNALRSHQIRLFNDAISDERFDVEHVYSDNNNFPKTLLALAVEEWRSTKDDQFVNLVLALGASLDQVDPAAETAPLHDIVRKGRPELLRLALRHAVPGQTDLNVQDGEGLTPLHAAVELLQDADEPAQSSILEMLRLLLRVEGVEVNAQDLRGGQTALFYAGHAASRPAVELLLEHGSDPDIAVDDGQTVRELIRENIPDFDFTAYVKKVKQRPLKQTLFNCVEADDVNGLKRLEFFASKGQKVDWNCDNGAWTPLQMACTHGHDKVAAYLLQKQCDPNRNTASEPRPPVLIAAHHGYFKILDLFKRCPRVNFAVTEKDKTGRAGTGKTVLHEVFRQDSAKHLGSAHVEGASYKKSLKVLLSKAYQSNPKYDQQLARIINYQEKLDGNTALHYATMQADQDVIKSLLQRGANMGVKNFRDKTPVQSILPDTLQEFLDEDCIESQGIITNEDFKITFRYDFLAPPLLDETMHAPKNAKEAEDYAENPENRALPETEALWYLSAASRQHKALLKHPVIASFLWLKWQRIRTFFYVNLFLYLAFVALLTSFIILRFGGYSVQPWAKSEASNDSDDSYSFNQTDRTAQSVLTIGLTVLVVILALRELFQLLVSVKRYIFNPENLMEVFILCLTCQLLFNTNEDNFEDNRHWAALCILFSWTEVLVLVGRHPLLSTNITMFTKVISTFLFFLSWYAIIIVAFGISFYVMMHQDHKDSEPDPKYPFFDTFWLALFKTSAMFVGELEFADIPFTGNLLSYLVFLAFIFLIVVVLMNLLNGLAVSDTGLIREEAEVVGWTSRVELITYLESMLLGDPFYFLSNWPPLKLLQKIPSCAVCRVLYKFPRARDLLQKISGGTKILLFYSCLPNKRATFYPNKKSHSSLLTYKKSLKVEDDEAGAGGRAKTTAKQQKLAISNDVLDSAKELLLQKMRADREEREKKEMRSAILAQQDQSERLLVIEELLLQLLQSKKELATGGV